MHYPLLNPHVDASTLGFFQVLDENNIIKAQRTGMQSPQQLEYVHNHWLNLRANHRIIFTEHSDYIEPFGFFSPCLKGTTITVYNDLVSKEDHASGDLSAYQCPEFQSKTLTVDDFDSEINDNKTWQTWVCFIGGKWAGTSEY